LDYYTLGERLICCVIKRSSVEVVEAFPSPIADVERTLAILKLTLRSTSSLDRTYQAAVLEPATRAHLHWLYAALLAPVAARLDAVRRLIVSPYGSLHYAPFHAFFDGAAYVVERWEVSYTPAASLILRQSDQVAPDRFTSPLAGQALVIGNSATGRLPFVVREAQAVAAQLPDATLLLEDAATAQAVEEFTGACSLLHLATHAVFRSDNPLFSYLHLADARLRLLDLYGLRLRRPLVVLSACETGLGQARGGDWVGLCRGFLGAGARAIIASLWRVDDAATAALMVDFYRNLAAGQAPAAALRAAQLAMLAQRPHPYFWAPFVVVGAFPVAGKEQEHDDL
jgi:CHAT domain-containing protein